MTNYDNYLLNRISMDAAICNGKPVIRGMRFTVAQMLELVAAGMTFDEIISDYPYLEREDISACLIYASSMANYKGMIPFEKQIA
ncbi:MAG: DUF433 domain-containing protein [Paludibacter sp.]|jgi:uncharacterized protein (DUF433 family)|nr:DUF433 domain-containing protein [Paludibacter sp.]